MKKMLKAFLVIKPLKIMMELCIAFNLMKKVILMEKIIMKDMLKNQIIK